MERTLIHFVRDASSVTDGNRRRSNAFSRTKHDFLWPSSHTQLRNCDFDSNGTVAKPRARAPNCHRRRLNIHILDTLSILFHMRPDNHLLSVNKTTSYMFIQSTVFVYVLRGARKARDAKCSYLIFGRFFFLFFSLVSSLCHQEVATDRDQKNGC